MKQLRCVSDKFKTPNEYAILNFKNYLKKIFLFPIVMSVLTVLAVPPKHSHSHVQLQMNTFLICLLLFFSPFALYGVIRYFLDRVLFDKYFSFGIDKIKFTVFKKERSLRYDQIYSFKHSKKNLTLRWFPKSFPWLISIPIESIDEPERAEAVRELINNIKLSGARISDRADFDIEIY